MKYSGKLKDPRWQKKRLEIFERDNFKCQSCGDTKTTLVVHHRIYLQDTEPWDCPSDLLVTICEDCHHAEYMEREGWEEKLIDELRKKTFEVSIKWLYQAINQTDLTIDPNYTIWVFAKAMTTPGLREYLIEKLPQYKGIKDKNK